MSNRSLGFVLGVLVGLVILGAVYIVVKPRTSNVANQLTKENTKTPDAIADGANLIVGKPKVKLAVLVVFDQMRGDYIDRWKSLYGNDGFNRLTRDGAHFTNCYYPYGITSTGPGHASMLTGTTPSKHGITNNEWFDRATATKSYCAGSERYQFVPAKPVSTATTSTTSTESVKVAGCPLPMKSPTVADVLKKATEGKSKVFGFSLKDRSACLPTGFTPDGAYWFDGRIVTSTYYRDTVHPWVAELNRSKFVDAWFETPWVKLRNDIDYTRFSGPDGAPGEGRIEGRGITFPHAMNGGKNDISKHYYEAVACSPYGNDIVLAMTKACLTAEKLGTHETPDLLTISFSSNDLVGHAYGPDSQEVMDVTLRSDLIMAELLKVLDEQVGKDQYVLAVTSDHGICKLPELAASLFEDAKRVTAITLLLESERHLQSKFGKLNGGFDDDKASKRDTWIETIQAPWLYLNERLCLAKKINKADVAKEYVAWLKQQPDVFNAYTDEELLKPETLDDTGKLMAKSYYPGRSGDLCVVMKPGYLIDSKVGSAGTNHGTPHDYDRYVPLIVYGPGVKPGTNDEAVTPQHCAPIFSHFLGISVPKDCEATMPKSLMTPLK